MRPAPRGRACANSKTVWARSDRGRGAADLGARHERGQVRPEHGQIRLIVAQDENRTRFTVHDTGAGPLPVMRPLERLPHQGGGHGLRLVEMVSDRWGVERGSTRVWFEFDL